MTARSLRLRKLARRLRSVHDRIAAMNYLQERAAAGEIVTGLIYVDHEPHDLHDHLETVEKPLNELGEGALPGLGGARALERGFALRGWAEHC